jgi:hypothetical protein
MDSIPHAGIPMYLCAIKGSDIPNKWMDAMTKMRRKCTVTLEAYVLPDDDPRVYKADGSYSQRFGMNEVISCISGTQ